MLRYVVFFLKTVALSSASLLQAILHSLYARLIPENESINSAELKILIIQLGQIGDFVLSVPLFTGLRKVYGDKLYLSVMLDQINSDLAVQTGVIDKTIVYNSRKYSRIKKKNRSTYPFSGLDWKMFDKVIWLRGDKNVFYWVIINRIPMKSIAIYANPLRLTWLSLISKKPNKKKYKHYLECLNEMFKEIVPGYLAYDFNRTPYMSLSPNSQREIYIHIGAGNVLRRWRLGNYSKLCGQLLEYDSAIFINLLGSKADWSIAEQIKNNTLLSKYFTRIRNICGKRDLTELAETLSNGDLFIGTDSGPMHIAALSGVPVVALMGPQSPQAFGPWGKQDIRLLYKNYFCSPCWQFACLHVMSGAGACVLAIRPEEVFEEAKSILMKKVNYEC